MNPTEKLIILGATMWGLNFIFGVIQIKDFNKNYIEMRKMYRVAIGRKKGGFKSGTVVMIGIDEDGRVLLSKKMQGFSVFARVKKFIGLEGKIIDNITDKDLKNYNKLTRVAILDAINNYKVFRGGDQKENTLVN